MQKTKCVVVGNGYVRKTILLIRHTTKTFQIEYSPTVFGNNMVTIKVKTKLICLDLWDIGRGQDYGRLRLL